MQNTGERQVAPGLDGIRRDHVARYEWVARQLPAGSRVIDIACGVGYGAWILARAGHRVLGLDRDPEAIAYARAHYRHRLARFAVANASAAIELEPADAATCFETVEHLADPRPLLASLRRAAPQLFASVPNEDVLPYTGQRFHFRHYTPGQFSALLAETGWRIDAWHGQLGPHSEVAAGRAGRTIIATARRGAKRVPQKDAPKQAPADPLQARGKHVAILGLGPSVNAYLELAKRQGGRQRLFDQTWAINALGGVFDCDLVVHMDDVRIQEIRAAARPEGNIAALLPWLKRSRVPVLTSRAHPKYPALFEFPLEDVVNDVPTAYFNSTAAYAVAYAVHAGVRKLSIFGMDFTYPDANQAERGRACVEFWLGIAADRGIELAIPAISTLMDAYAPRAERFYGYDCVELAIARDANGRIRVGFTELAELPSAEEIEARYDHSVHPNAIVAATLPTA